MNQLSEINFSFVPLPIKNLYPSHGFEFLFRKGVAKYSHKHLGSIGSADVPKIWVVKGNFIVI